MKRASQKTLHSMLVDCAKARTTESKERKALAFWRKFARLNGWVVAGYSFEHCASLRDRFGGVIDIDRYIRDAMVKWMDISAEKSATNDRS
jgi:hypothetical protein